MIIFTVYYEGPFWVGIFEKHEADLLYTARVVFGAEPKDEEVYNFINNSFRHLHFSHPVTFEAKARKKLNPKRLLRQARKATQNQGIGTKAQQALKLEHEWQKLKNKQARKKKKEDHQALKYQLKQAKKKEKRKGH